MGGIVCQILHNSIMTDPTSDAQWRTFYASDEVAQSVVNDTESADQLCTILAKPSFSALDKATLTKIANSLWKGYD